MKEKGVPKHLHDEIELEGVKVWFVLGAHAKGSLEGAESERERESGRILDEYSHIQDFVRDEHTRIHKHVCTSRNNGSLNKDDMVSSSSKMKFPKLCTRDIMRSYDSFKPTTPPYLR